MSRFSQTHDDYLDPDRHLGGGGRADEEAHGSDDAILDAIPELLITRYPPALTEMTIRDYFAAAALQGHLARGDLIEDSARAARAYSMADAMLKERAK